MFTSTTVHVKTVAVISQKGGAGKTTIAVHLAVAAERSGKAAAVVDLDPQASASTWSDLRSEGTPAVVVAQPARLQKILDTARENGARFVVIDTAPHSESAALAAARSSDLLLIPCRPAILDLRAIHSTVDLAKLAQAPAAIVLNAVPPRGGIGDDAEAALSSYGLPVVPVRLTQRAAYVHALTVGQTAQEYEPDGKAAEEISALYKWTRIRVGV